MRTSEDKIIKDKDVFEIFYPQYKNIVDKLIKSYPAIDGGAFEGLVNFKQNIKCPKHNWYNYKQGYAKRLVNKIITDANIDNNLYVLDPFCGVGTTNLTALDLGYKSLGFDINPMAILATRVKTHFYSNEEISTLENLIETFVLPNEKSEIDAGKVVITSFTEEVLDILLKIKFYVESLKDRTMQDVFRLALVSIIDDCSLKVKDGNGLKFKKNYKPIPDLVGHYLSKLSGMLSDIKFSNSNGETDIFFGSMMNDDTFSNIEDKKVGLCIFSPPYANCFDYCEVYKLEFWIGGFVSSYSDFEKYRSIAMRSHVNSKFDHNIYNENKTVDIISNLVSSFNVWNKNIPDMLRGYFDDMHRLLLNIKKVLVKGGKCYIVVANSGYKGILVPTDLLIADIAHNIGFDVNNIYHARKIRSSSQQMQILNDGYDNLMRESIIELQLNQI